MLGRATLGVNSGPRAPPDTGRFTFEPACVRVRGMTTRALIFALALVPLGCSGGDKTKDDGKAAKADSKGDGKTDTKDGAGDEKGDASAESGGEPSLQVAADDDVDPGPVPPESDMVFFVVENSLLPLGCFVKDEGAIKAGKDCLGLPKEGDEARVGSASATDVTKIGGPTEPLCLAGSGKKVALAGDGLGGGATFHFGAWPRSTYKAITVVEEETLEPDSLNLSEEQQTKLLAAVVSAGGKGDTVKAHQVASLDVNGSGEPDLLFSVFTPDPKTDERYLFSGAFLAMDGNLDGLTLLEKSRSKEDVFEARATVDLDGDGSRELWMRMVFAEGAGDRLVNVAGGKAAPVGPWTCGA